MESSKPTLLITGINGYIGSWIALKVLETEEYHVRGSVRGKCNYAILLDKTNQEKLATLREALGDRYDEVELVNADLTDKDSLKEAVSGCQYVIHVASPLPAESPKDEDEVIRPAVQGNLGILRACVGTEVKRVVITSSCVAIFDFTDGERDVDENDFAKVNKHLTPYFKSKIMSEKAAWDFMDNLPEADKNFDIVTINPGLVMGKI